MIQAGIYFLLEKVSSLTEEDILKMPYPEFKDKVSYYADPQAYLKIELTEEDEQRKVNAYKDKLSRFRQRRK